MSVGGGRAEAPLSPGLAQAPETIVPLFLPPLSKPGPGEPGTQEKLPGGLQLLADRAGLLASFTEARVRRVWAVGGRLSRR
jgi:hypothetical protein